MKTFFVWFFAVIVASTIYGFASSNTGGDKRGGEGLNQISGWTVSNIKYTSADNPSKLRAVELDLDSRAGTVMVGVVSASHQYYRCTNTIGNHWRCEIKSDVDIASMDSLRVIASGD